ncbi:hypothetical protein KP509_38G050200 [Ceratopteris richardii]|uniref:Golgi apparatus membrane protein TVP15 n=1 Tax=Ceratopteris richardii TaxID=49495 RepID=A0A8T2Q5N9_CERRI|nr:hypothetical protein KP509_38G050200 [Ceratopteris richardii]
MSISTQDPELLPEDDAPPDLSIQYLKREDSFLTVCRCFSGITAISALLCVVANVFSAIHAFKNGNDIFGGVLRCYAIVIALFVAVAESEWQRIFQFWRILEYWAGRGMLQVFVGVMTRALSDLESGGKALVILQQLSSYMLLGCGLLYIFSGILCIGHLKRARMKKAKSREEALRDLEELEQRRKELQSLLVRRN